VNRTIGYEGRARFYAAEIAAVPEPRLLTRLLRPGLRVAEMPSATGHFLSAYAACQAQVTLVDCCQEMLSAAGRRAEGIGLQGFRLVLNPIQNLASETGPVDLVVIPNAALNQLAAGTHLVTLLTAVAQVLKPGGLLLLQILDLHDDGTIGACNFYTPGTGERELVTDRKFTDDDGSLLVRRRQQSCAGRILHLRFQFLRNDRACYRHSVELRLLGVDDVRAALSVAGFGNIHAYYEAGRLTEVLACAGSAS